MKWLTKEEFERKVDLLRNPEMGKCPVCKSELKTDRLGDTRCVNFSLDAKPGDGKCIWHRYKNGLNYWSSQSEVIKALSEEHGIPLPKGMI